MHILTAEQIRALDAYTIENEPISSIDLMERAARKCTEFLLENFSSEQQFIIFCGKGNNGGDGLAIARQLLLKERIVQVIIVEHSERSSSDFKVNLERLKAQKQVEIVHLDNANDISTIESNAVIVDAILGTGLSRPLHGLVAEVVNAINLVPNLLVSIDIPTGLFSEDNSSNNIEAVIHADITLTFHAPKLSFLLPDTGNCVGEFHILSIGLMAEEMNVSSPYIYVRPDELRLLLKQRPKFSHKGTYGHALLIAGSEGKMGAAQLAAQACLRSGTGLLTCHVPKAALRIMQVGVKEAMCSVDDSEDTISELPKLEKYTAIGFGPGIGTEQETANVLKRLIQDCPAKLVVDADGLNILGENRTWLSFLPKGTILTPHPKEFERMAGPWESSHERLQLQQEFSKKNGIVVVLKGAHTSITTPAGQVFFNSTGNSGLATAGSGDVLTGIILGLLAQGYSSEVAAVLGVYLHGSAGDKAIEKQTEETLITRDIIDNLGKAFRDISI